MTTPWHEQYKPRLFTVQVTAVPPGAVWCSVGATIYVAQYEQFFVGGLAPGETLETFDRYWERPMSDWALAFGGLRWKERAAPPSETMQWSHDGACDLPGSLCKPEDICQRCGRPSGEHANYPANAPPKVAPVSAATLDLQTRVNALEREMERRFGIVVENQRSHVVALALQEERIDELVRLAGPSMDMSAALDDCAALLREGMARAVSGADGNNWHARVTDLLLRVKR